MDNVTEKLMEKSTPPWSFHQYMETALYDADVGYYSRAINKLGKEGDFYTNNHIHAVFSETFSRYFLDVFEKETMDWFICEWGAGDGAFAYHALNYFKEKDLEKFKNMKYLIIESSPYHQQKLKEVLDSFSEQVQVYSTLEEIKRDYPDFKGIIFSNELIDAFPVYVVEQNEEGLKEVFVNEVDGKLVENLLPCENDKLFDWLDKFGPTLPNGHRFEICLEMASWMREMADWLKKGQVVTVDYGYSNEMLGYPERKDGSIRGYRNHQMIRDPLMHSGEMDLTAHIQWDAYMQLAKKKGFSFIYFDRQSRFLLKAGLFTFLQSSGNINPFSDEFKKNRAIQTFVQPGGISDTFQVAVHGQNLEHVSDYCFFREDPYQIKKP